MTVNGLQGKDSQKRCGMSLLNFLCRKGISWQILCIPLRILLPISIFFSLFFTHGKQFTWVSTRAGFSLFTTFAAHFPCFIVACSCQPSFIRFSYKLYIRRVRRCYSKVEVHELNATTQAKKPIKILQVIHQRDVLRLDLRRREQQKRISLSPHETSLVLCKSTVKHLHIWAAEPGIRKQSSQKYSQKLRAQKPAEYVKFRFEEAKH